MPTSGEEELMSYGVAGSNHTHAYADDKYAIYTGYVLTCVLVRARSQMCFACLMPMITMHARSSFIVNYKHQHIPVLKCR